jgi:hypothetical protein
VRIPDENTKLILRLIAEGENLDTDDLEAFYQWIHDSYEALEFNPVQKQRFDTYCRSSSDSTSMRVYIGVWILKLSIWEWSQDFIDQQERLTLTESVLSLPRKDPSDFSRKKVK